ncbi:MAG: accessory factor UbiK family protein [Legionella sp.]|uniref:ubiquinone biosynthesis accessory factor UbiK n=1 Tax=Legionella sp. TaxID=459 RepID=UPI0039E52157
MFDPKQFDDLAKKLFAALPPSLQNIEKDIQQKFKEVLQATFAHMDLVTREEFDVQSKVLARTREKLDQIQKQIDELMSQKTKKKH